MKQLYGKGDIDSDEDMNNLVNIRIVNDVVKHTLTAAFAKASIAFVVDKEGTLHACVVGAHTSKRTSSAKGHKTRVGVSKTERMYVRRALRKHLADSLAGVYSGKMDKLIIVKTAVCPITDKPIGKCDPRVVAAMCWFIFGMKLLSRAQCSILDSMCRKVPLTDIKDDKTGEILFPLAKRHPELMGIAMSRFIDSRSPWYRKLI